MANHSPLTALVEYEVRVKNSDVGQWLDVWQGRGQDALFGEPETFCLLYTSPSPRDATLSRMPSSA